MEDTSHINWTWPFRKRVRQTNDIKYGTRPQHIAPNEVINQLIECSRPYTHNSVWINYYRRHAHFWLLVLWWFFRAHYGLKTRWKDAEFVCVLDMWYLCICVCECVLSFALYMQLSQGNGISLLISLCEHVCVWFRRSRTRRLNAEHLIRKWALHLPLLWCRRARSLIVGLLTFLSRKVPGHRHLIEGYI